MESVLREINGRLLKLNARIATAGLCGAGAIRETMCGITRPTTDVGAVEA